MDSNNTSEHPVAVLGAGSFGTVIANILANNSRVFFYARNTDSIEQMKKERVNNGVKLHDNIIPCGDLEEIAKECTIIFPVVSSGGFRDLIRKLSVHLYPYHQLIHGTKGFDLDDEIRKDEELSISREHVKTMSEVIQEESVVVKVGCLAGPNLASELAREQPAATVVASHFDQVIKNGQRLLRTNYFQVYGNADLIGIELSGALKNIIAIASGAVTGLGFGENSRALLISRGLIEMIHIGQVLGGDIRGFLGLAGVGDLVATCQSKFSRNYSVGFRLATGETIDQILSSMDEVAEGVNTIYVTKRMMEHYKVRAPITETLYQVLFKDLSIEEGLTRLMKLQFGEDISFI